jgi:hypothetical protein
MAIGENLTNKEKQYVALGALAVALLVDFW